MQSGGGLQRLAGAALAQVEVLARQLDDRLVDVDCVGRDAAWTAEGGAIQAIWRPPLAEAPRDESSQSNALELSARAERLEP